MAHEISIFECMVLLYRVLYIHVDLPGEQIVQKRTRWRKEYWGLGKGKHASKIKSVPSVEVFSVFDNPRHQYPELILCFSLSLLQNPSSLKKSFKILKI